MTMYLFAVQDSGGREVASGYADVEKVSTVTAVAENGAVTIRHGDDTVALSSLDPGGDLMLYRVQVTDEPGWKLETPVKHKVPRP